MKHKKSHNVFPVVHRIREEIDFCFSSFYGNPKEEEAICDTAFDSWVSKGYRGPGQLSIYINMLEQHLPLNAQKNIFSHLANDCITIVKKSSKPVDETFLQRNRFWIMFNLGLVLTILVVYFSLGKLTGTGQ